MIRHLLQMIWNQRKQNAWLWIELLLVSVLLWFLVDYMYVMGRTYTAPLGFDIKHTYQLCLGDLSDSAPGYLPADQRTATDGALLIDLMDRMRAYPGIEAVCCSDAGMPYSYASRNLSWTLDTLELGCRWMRVSPDYFKVFQVEGDDVGPDELTAALLAAGSDGVVASRDVGRDAADFKLSVGQRLTSRFMMDRSFRVVAICNSIRRCDYDRAEPVFFIPVTDSQIAKGYYDGSMNGLEICFRVKPEMDGAGFITRFREDMARQARVGNIFMLDVRPLSYARDGYLRANGTEDSLKTGMAIALFLLVNIFLGIIGTFWFRTEYRKGEMGLRMALGSTRGQLKMIMAGEGILLLLLAFIPSLLICLNLVYMDLAETYLLPFTGVRFLLCSAITFFLIVCMIICGVWYPARVTAELQPAESLRHE